MRRGRRRFELGLVWRAAFGFMSVIIFSQEKERMTGRDLLYPVSQGG